MRTRFTTLGIDLIGFGLMGCTAIPARETPADRWQNPKAEWQKTIDGLDLTFSIKPERPDKTQPAELELLLVDRRSTPSSPVVDAVVEGTALMPRVPGHIHVLALNQLHREKQSGRYGMHLQFGMAGEWLATFQIQSKDGRSWQVDFPFIVTGEEKP